MQWAKPMLYYYLNMSVSIVKYASVYGVDGIKIALPKIEDENYNLRCNRVLLYLCSKIKNELYSVIEKYGKNRVGVVIATTNSGIEEFEETRNKFHSEIGNPALFLKDYLNLNSFAAGVSCACTSGIKAFSTARNLLKNGICDAVIVGGVDTFAKLTKFGFGSLEVLSGKKTNPFSKNREGIDIGEGAALFILENILEGGEKGIKLLGIGETSDAYHAATPDPEGIETIRAIKEALKDAKITAQDVDYINLHGTGTLSNDLMEAVAVHNVFGDRVYCSSTKPVTGHCLGSSASVETAICCELLDNPQKPLPEHIYDGEYDEDLPKIKLVGKNVITSPKIVMCNAFGFGGTNAVMILGKGV